jgi:hypothetical protein
MGMACMEIFPVIIEREFDSNQVKIAKKITQNSCRPKNFAQKPVLRQNVASHNVNVT